MAHKDNNSFYNRTIKKYGISARGVHWNSQYTQYKRFEILTEFIKDEIKNSTIIDAGCGFGEYYNYLFDNNLKPKSYIGLDCEKQMIELARKRFLNVNFYLTDILTDELEQADYYICSGALSILTKNEIKTFIDKCFNASKKGFIFNFLKNDSLTNIKSQDILSHVKTLTENITIKDNYLDNDFSIFMKK